MIPIRFTAPSHPDPAASAGIPRTMAAVAATASGAAPTYLHRALITEARLRPARLPAYHSAGSVSAHDDPPHADATPAGPHRSASPNSDPMTANSISAQRNSRSGLPIDR